MASTVSRSIRSFVIHGRIEGEPMDYEDFFEWVSSVPRSQTRVQVAAQLVLAVERVWREEGDYHFRFVSGNPDEVPQLYVEDTGEVVDGATRKGTWPVVTTRVTVRPLARVLVVEVRQAGVGGTNLERFFTRLATGAYASRVSLDLNALPGPSFGAELDNFTRIREASLVVKRPNSDWDDAEDILSDLADESGAQRAAVTVNAERGESLSKRTGIIGLITEHLRRPLTNVSNARITGSVPGSTEEKTVSLERHQLQTRVQVPRSASVSDLDESIFEAERELLDESERLVLERGTAGLTDQE